ncbi:histidinol-phosphate transaminase [Spiribacter onubensis]|uniref:Histidinol-phosphate aminotransferase n=1 Tax=Spiribacter onubensis TaxID=3122420 RepID=A0ABV3S6I4_9GAMM
MSYQRDNIRRMAGYTPGEQPTDPGVIKLNTNENPWPPSPAVMSALAAIAPEDLRRYPSPTAAGFLAEAARLHGIGSDQLVATNGGDELLRLAITTFVPPGAPIGVAEPSYSLYPVLAAIHDSPVHAVELDGDWSLPADFASRMNAAGVPLTLLVNPHAPSGRLLDANAISAIAAALDGVLLVDEAYVDFTDPGHDLTGLTRRHDNLMILRTLSKGYSLAGLRLGYGIGPIGLIEPMARKTRDSYSVDAVADALGAAALADQPTARASWEAVRAERTRLIHALRERGFAIPDSESNFCLARVPDQSRQPAAELYRGLKEGGILVRHFGTPRLVDCLRITVGTPEQNDALLRGLDALLSP